MSKTRSFFILAITVIFCSININAAAWTVTKSTNSGDGMCDADCSLREAVAAADSGDTIAFNSNLIGQTFTLGGAEIVITKHIMIDGNLDGTNVAFISGSQTSRIFFIQAGGGLDLRNAILVQGNGNGINMFDNRGGAINAVDGASLTLNRVAIRGNSADFGGGINLGNGTHHITDSSFTTNTATNGCSAIRNAGGTANLYMANVTISGNSDSVNDNSGLGAVCNTGGNSFIRNSTIVNNKTDGGGGGIWNGASGNLNLGNTIVARNTASAGTDIYSVNGTITSVGGNLVGDLDTVPPNTFNQPNDASGLNPLLAPTNSNQGGHPLATHPLQAGSPARNTGINSNAVDPLTNQSLTLDARGTNFPRISGGTVDKGAFEDQTNGSSLVVSKLTNSNDNVCDTDCSLREAVAAAANDAGTDTIIFAANVFGTLDLGGSEILIQNNDVNIVGYPALDAETLIASGNNTNRIFRINNSDVSISGMTFANGNGVGFNSGFGGAIYAQVNSNLTLNSVVVRDNRANNYGALYLLNGTHRIINSTVNNNRATNCVAIGNVNGVLNMANTTVSANFDSDGGVGAGALCNINATANIRNSTIAFNRLTDGSGAGIWSNGTLNIGNTIVSSNLAGSNPDIDNSGTVNSVGGNLVQDTNGFANGTFNQINDVIGVDPLLGALGDNNGNVTTHSLLPNSPAMNSGVNAHAVDSFDNSALPTDARGTGYSRILNGTVDKGAFESISPTAAPVSVAGRITDGKRGIAGAKVEMTDQYGVARFTSTNSSGRFRFEGVDSGATYIFNVSAKNYTFSTQVLNITEATDEIDFVGESGWGASPLSAKQN